MGAGATKKDNNFKIKNARNIKIVDIVTIDGSNYCDIKRKDYKLNDQILKIMECKNNFSSEMDDFHYNKNKSLIKK